MPQNLFISELQLIMEYKRDSYKHGFADIFLCLINDGISQLNRYLQTIKKERAQINLKKVEFVSR